MCSKCFKQPCDLKSHLRIHSDERPFKCEICAKGFRQSNHLKNHFKVHIGERP
ncbi:MAG: hypothetical protein GY696_27625 [Gammaproteobacteria bacterium]|nr:hypothetical protein [Gammaproteobacteria bacterium]